MKQASIAQLEHAIVTMECAMELMRRWQFERVHDTLAGLKGELRWIRDKEEER